MSWKLDEIKIINLENKQLKFKVELRKESNKFILVYEGHNTNCIINNLQENTNYEIRVCTIFNNIESNWTKIYRIKTDLDSSILNNNPKKREYINKILEWTGFKSMDLIYRGTRDGMSSNDFHNKCDNKGKTLCLFLNEKDIIFGGYSSIPWTNNGGDKIAKDCFIFTLTNIYNIEPTKFQYDNGRSVYHLSTCGPVFGEGSDLGSNYSNFTADKAMYSNFPSSYKDSLGKGKSIFTGDNNVQHYKLKEIEVFKLV